MMQKNAPIPQALQQAEQCLISGNLVQAEAICRIVVAEAPQHAKAIHMLGFIALQTNRSEEALDLLDKSVTAQPNDAEAQFHLGNALIWTRQFERALHLYQQLTQIHPHHARSWAWLGIS